MLLANIVILYIFSLITLASYERLNGANTCGRCRSHDSPGAFEPLLVACQLQLVYWRALYFQAFSGLPWGTAAEVAIKLRTSLGKSTCWFGFRWAFLIITNVKGHMQICFLQSTMCSFRKVIPMGKKENAGPAKEVRIVSTKHFFEWPRMVTLLQVKGRTSTCGNADVHKKRTFFWLCCAGDGSSDTVNNLNTTQCDHSNANTELKVWVGQDFSSEMELWLNIWGISSSPAARSLQVCHASKKGTWSRAQLKQISHPTLQRL